jgi:hypothetical protein
MNRDDDDDALLARLRAISAQTDAVPDAVLAAARAAIETRNLDNELATLIADSAATTPDQAFEAVRRGPPGSVAERLLSFEGGGVQVELEVARHGDGLTLMGQVVGVAPGECVLERGTGPDETLHLDELGRFLAEGVPAGPARLRCRSTTGRIVVTAWVSL